ncbi:MAG: protein translocase subunit SecF [Myxococcota bacterium]
MEFFKPGTYFNFMGQRKIWLAISSALCLASIVLFFTKGLNFGTDFRGGTEVEVAFQKPVDAGDIRSAVQNIGFSKPDVVHVEDEDNPHRFMIRVQEVSSIDDQLRGKIMEALCYASVGGGAPSEDRCPKAKQPTEIKFSPGGDKISLRYDNEPDLGFITSAIQSVPGVEMREGENNPQIVSARDRKVEVRLKSKGDQLMDGLRSSLGVETVPDAPMRVEWVGPKAGKLLRNAAFKSIGIAVIFIMAYIAFRFDMRFAPGAILAMIHDVLIVLGVFMITGKEFSLTIVAALLTIVGYSVNDTVVVYDRIRENLGKHRGKTFPTIINMSVSEVLSRTILTSSTTLIVLGSFLALGTGAIKDFAFAMFLGTIVGTYSSIYVASPLTEAIDRRIFGGTKSPGKKPRPQKREAAVV